MPTPARGPQRPALALWTFGRALFWVGAVRLGLTVLPFQRLLRIQRRAARVRPRQHPVPHEVETRVSRAITRAARFVPGPRCLAEALAGQVLLARAGLASDLRIGVARSADAGLDAHAWLESGGRAVHGAAEPGRYTLLRETRRGH